MLVAPPVPSPTRAPGSAATATEDSRAILGGSARPAAVSTSGPATGVALKGNGSAFAIFRDGGAASSSNDGTDASSAAKAGWDDYGTVKSRTRENNAEKKEWEGETLPVQAALARPAANGFKLEVYRDEVSPVRTQLGFEIIHLCSGTRLIGGARTFDLLQTATAATSAHRLDDPDVFSRSSRAPSEAELLRSNPFRHYSARDLELIANDPLEGLEVLPRATKNRSASASNSNSATSGSRKSATASGERKDRKTATTKSSALSNPAAAKAATAASSTTAPGSSSGARKSRYPPMMNPPDTSGLDAKPKERVAVNLREIYPAPGEEYSPEEVRARTRRETYVDQDVQTWNGWEWTEKFDEEVQRTGRALIVPSFPSGESADVSG